MKLALATSLLSVVCFPEEVAAFTASSRAQIVSSSSKNYAPQPSTVVLQAAANTNNDNEVGNRQLNRRDALFRFATAATTALISGSQIAVADDDDEAIQSSATSTSNTLTVAKEDDFNSAPPTAPPKDVQLKVAMEKSPETPVAKQPVVDDSKMVAKMEEEVKAPVAAKKEVDDSKMVAKMEEEVKAPVAAKKEVDLKVAALEKEEKQEPVKKNETNLLAKITDDADNGSSLLLPTGKAVVKASAPAPASSFAASVASVAAESSASVLAGIDAPGAAAKTIDSTLIGGGAAFAALLALVGIASSGEEEVVTTLPTGTASTNNIPYGLDGGRNYGEAPEKQPATAVPAPAVELDPAVIEATKAWKESQPKPYGILNEGNNPFVKEMLEYCEGGKVTEKCTETITEFMEDIASTGAVASDEEVNTIVGYLDSLGSTSSERESTGAAIVGYLDALSVGTAPGPKNAKAVATYLDTLGGSSGEIPKPFSPPGKANPAPVAAAPAVEDIPAPVVPTPVEEPAPVTAAPSPEFSQFDSRLKEIESQGSSTSSIIQKYDSRLNTIETRVTSLESKVDAIPDQVYEKMDAWQSKADLRLSEEVKKIISILTPEAQDPPSTPAPVAPVVPPPAPVPAPVAAPVVASTPAAVAMDNPMLAGNAASAPKKSYGLGNASWKN